MDLSILHYIVFLLHSNVDRLFVIFHVNANGTLCYYVNVKNTTGVLTVDVGFKNGTDFALLLNPYAEVATIASIPQDLSIEYWEVEKLRQV